jgi:hypothetical protein
MLLVLLMLHIDAHDVMQRLLPLKQWRQFSLVVL